MSARVSSRREAEEQLILQSAGTSARRQATRQQAERLAAQVDWSLVTERLRVRRLLPTLGPRMLDLAADRAGDDFAVVVQQALDAARRQGAFFQMMAERVTTALTGAGIRSTALKGPQLGEILYGEPGRRLSGDIDLLVAREQLSEAVRVVRELGYAQPTDHVDDDGLPALHFALVHEREQLPSVEIHWRIHWYERSFAQERLLVPSECPTGAWRPAPIDELAALLLFYARDGFIDLRLAADLGAWWDGFGAGLEPYALDETISAYPALERALSVAVRVAARTVGVPAELITQRRAKLDRRARLANRLAAPHLHASQPQVYADMGLIDGLLTPPGGLRAFVKRQVILPREVLREHARRSPRRQRPNSQLGHAVRVIGRYGLSIVRLFRAPADVQSE
jgi:hypothetical protein